MLVGAEVKKNKVGTQGDFALFFYAQKNITTLGEGGMLYFKNSKFTKILKQMRHNGHCDFDFKEKVLASSNGKQV